MLVNDTEINVNYFALRSYLHCAFIDFLHLLAGLIQFPKVEFTFSSALSFCKHAGIETSLSQSKLYKNFSDVKSSSVHVL